MVEKNTLPGWWSDMFEPLRHAGERVADWFSPRSDASAGDNSYEINVELPGVKEDDIEVELHDGVLSVRGEKKHERREEREGYFFSERQYGRFQRTFRLPPDAAEEGITASFRDGILTVSVPKSEPAEPPSRRIQVKRG
jgi:HSP20 family protein